MNNLKSNKTSINLNECENILKTAYNITDNNSLYLLKVESDEGMKIPKIEYEVYSPLNGNKLEKLNLTLCKDIRIEISIPVIINDDINKYNTSSDYYNNICSKAISDKGADLTI